MVPVLHVYMGVAALTSLVPQVVGPSTRAVAYDPAAHALQERAPALEVKVPAPQLAQVPALFAPVAAEKLPIPHRLHHVLPDAEEYVPPIHEAQTVAACAPKAVEYVPALHAVQTAEAGAPTAVEYVPTLHRVQIAAACAPMAVEYVPAAHRLQFVIPNAEE